MLKKISLLSTALFIFFIQLNAAGVRHSRSGKILAAELTRANIQIANLAPHHFADLPVEKAYAVISIQLNDMRVLSIFDYTLNIAGADFPCVALWRNGKFEYFTENVSGTGIQQLLFIVDNKLIFEPSKIDLLLKSNYVSTQDKYNMMLPFTIIGTRPPTLPNKIPAAGLLELPEE